ncbi:proton-conducting transporter membrane subunit [Haloarculaceae archaeon H-GB1-1]|nr:proton-conducting transporter membrane subunit [Haloarculaceae archaeon H-GB1-1]
MSLSHVVIAPMLVALVTAIVTLLTRSRPTLQGGLSLLGVVGYAVAVAVLVGDVLSETVLTYQLSNWAAPFGITLVADALSAFMLVLAAVVSLAALAFSVIYVNSYGQRVSYHPLFHFMLVGVTGSFLTGDIFNLFVWFEVMLMPSYVFVVFYSGKAHTSAALKYTVLNLIGSAVMLVAIGGLYSTTGTLNMADMTRRLLAAEEYGIDPAPVLGLAALLFAVFALKAGIVPFQFWVPEAYSAAPAPITAVLAGVTKKVGVYAIIRLYFTVFAAATLPEGLGLPGLSGTSFLAFFGPVMFLMALGSIFLGGFGAVSRPDLDGVFAYSSIGQVGFIVLPLAVGATVPAVRSLAIVAALVYSLNHAIAKSLLFLVSGTVDDAVGAITFDDIGGLTGEMPVLSAGFFVGSLALIGIPPLTGFFGKLLVFQVASDATIAGGNGATLALAAALAGAILTIAYLSRAWKEGFWGETTGAVEGATATPGLVAVVVGLATLLVVVGVGFDPVYQVANAAADAALARTDYVRAVGLEVSS